MPTAGALLLWSAVTLALYPLAAGSFWTIMLAVFTIGLGGGLGAVLQTRLMDLAQEGQGLAAALTHSAFNIANALGPWAAGLAITAGLGWAVAWRSDSRTTRDDRGKAAPLLIVQARMTWLFQLRLVRACREPRAGVSTGSNQTEPGKETIQTNVMIARDPDPHVATRRVVTTAPWPHRLRIWRAGPPAPAGPDNRRCTPHCRIRRWCGSVRW